MVPDAAKIQCKSDVTERDDVWGREKGEGVEGRGKGSRKGPGLGGGTNPIKSFGEYLIMTLFHTKLLIARESEYNGSDIIMKRK